MRRQQDSPERPWIRPDGGWVERMIGVIEQWIAVGCKIEFIVLEFMDEGGCHDERIGMERQIDRADGFPVRGGKMALGVIADRNNAAKDNFHLFVEFRHCFPHESDR